MFRPCVELYFARRRGAKELTMKTIRCAVFASFLLCAAATGFAQNFEVTGYGGGQFTGGADLSTTIFQRIEVDNSANYGVIVGYLIGEHGGVEFQWNRSTGDTRLEPRTGGPSVKIFALDQNQYMGNFVFHFKERESKLRPFAFFGLGASHLSPDRANVDSITRFAFAIGGGAKVNLHKHFGLRGQVRYAPTYLTTTTEGFWCDPFWGGCWTVGDDHYLHAFDVSAGITFRF
jgi:opacity protein-like surface antigen